MTIKSLVNPRNIMIILCIFMLVLLGEKSFRIADKIKAVHEAGRLYEAGDLIGAEEQYRQAAANSSIRYLDKEIADRMEKLAPITTIRNTLATLVLSSREQAATQDLAGLIRSYESLIALKAQYMVTGSAYETYYRQLSAASGLSDQLISYFQQFKKQYYAEMEQSRSSTGNTGDSFKWNLLLIPEAYFGGTEAKARQLAERFKSHDTRKLAALAAAGNFEPFLVGSLSFLNGYKTHNYEAPWVLEQTEAGGKLILGKDLEKDNAAAFAGHAVSFRNFARDAGIASSNILSFINNNTNKLLQSAARLTRAGQYAEAIQLYGELAPLQDTSAEIASVNLAWNIAEPVRLLPGGQEPDRYSFVISEAGRFGTKAYAIGLDAGGRMYYAAVKGDDSVTTLSGDVVAGFGSLRALKMDQALSSHSGLPVAVAEAGREDGRTDYTAYAIKEDGISVLFSFSGGSYELQEDGSIVVQNADTGDGMDEQSARYRQSDGVYQFAEIVQEYQPVPAAELELHPYEKVMLNCQIFQDYNGKPIAYAEGRYLSLTGNTGIGGISVIFGQFQKGYDTILTDFGELYVPVFVVESTESLSSAP